MGSPNVSIRSCCLLHISLISTSASRPRRSANDTRARYQRGETVVVDAMTKFASLAGEAREALEKGDVERLLHDDTFRHAAIDLSPASREVEMIEAAQKGKPCATRWLRWWIVEFIDEQMFRI